MWEKEKKKREKKKEKREKTKEKRNIKFYEDLLTKTCLNLKKFFKHPPTMVGNVYLGSNSRTAPLFFIISTPLAFMKN